MFVRTIELIKTRTNEKELKTGGAFYTPLEMKNVLKLSKPQPH